MYFKHSNVLDINKLINKEYKFYAHSKKIIDINNDDVDIPQDDNIKPFENDTNIKKEFLWEHTNLCLKYFDKICRSKELHKVFINFEKYYFNNMSLEGRQIFREMIINTIGFHDIGKINPNFQIKNMDNIDGMQEYAFEFSSVGSKHSIISSTIYIDYYLDSVMNIEDKEEKKKLRTMLFINAYVISKHHGDLDEFFKFLDSFNDKDMSVDGVSKIGLKVIDILKNNYKDVYLKGFSLSCKRAGIQCRNTKKFMGDINGKDSIYLYTYCRLIFSILVACDYYATTHFMNDSEITSFGDIEEINKIYDVYKDTDVYKSIRKYEKEAYNNMDNNLKDERNINILRNEMFLDAERELIKNKHKSIFFLEAPTGSGKSNVSMNISFKLIEDNSSLKKIFYVYPFNTLVEQNLESLNKTFGKNEDVFSKIAVINSIYPIKMKKEEEEYDDFYKQYSKALLNRQFLNYPLVLTTHVSLFNTMFGSSKESSFAFHQLAHSVIVLDEIQSYKNIIWSEIISFLNGFAEILNIKVIIMSATLPKLQALASLSNENSYSSDLILDRDKYFSNNLFKNRVTVNYDLLNSNDTIFDLYNHVVKNMSLKKKILIEFIKKQSAYDFYNKLKYDFEEDKNEKHTLTPIIELMTGDDNEVERKRILKEVKCENSSEKGMILIATQVIEAGVDIDMDIGYKDISKLDSDEQFMGRINRSCKRSGEVYFFNLDKTDYIYKDDLRANKELSLLNDEMKYILINKNFSEYYAPVLKLIKENYNETLNDSNLSDFFVHNVGRLNFKSIENRMRLIDDNDWNMSVYLGRIIKKEVDGGYIEINGVKVWNDYKKLLQNNTMNYAEKQVKLSRVKSLMNYFIYEIKKSVDIPYNDKIGELYFIEDGDKYFEGEKLNKEKFISDGAIFLDL